MKLQDILENQNTQYHLMSDDELVNIGVTKSENIPAMVRELAKHNRELPERVQERICSRNGSAIRLIIEAGIIPSEAVQKAACSINGWVLSYIIKLLKPLGKFPSYDVQLTACKEEGVAIIPIIKSGRPVSDELLDAAFSRLISQNESSWISEILNSSEDYKLPVHIQQELINLYPEFLTEVPHRFPEMLKPIINNLRSALETHKYPLNVIYKMIEIVYHDDEDTVATLKHRANAIQRKLDERDKYK